MGRWRDFNTKAVPLFRAYGRDEFQDLEGWRPGILEILAVGGRSYCLVAVHFAVPRGSRGDIHAAEPDNLRGAAISKSGSRL
jgi:hypothetical protein